MPRPFIKTSYRKAVGKEGWLKTFAIRVGRRTMVFMISETKWHKGGEHREDFVWKDEIIGMSTIFIGKLMIAYQKEAR